jgi:hypothetical protein
MAVKSTRGPGQPSKLKPDVVARLLNALRSANYVDSSCAYAGIHQGTYYEWMKRGEREKEGEYREFYEAVEHAKAEAEVSLVMHWRARAPEDFRAASLMLARRYPDKWSPRESTPQEVTVSIKHDNGRDKPSKPARRAKRDK